MTVLSVYKNDGSGKPEHIRNFDEIAKRLESVGVLIERWEASKPLSEDAQSEEVQSVYKESIERLNAKYGFKSIDVVSLRPDNPKREDMRKMFLTEHAHKDFEIRFFVDGSGLFYLHINGKVYCILCEKGDLLSVPANTTHWFDMGTAPSFKAIRLFTTDNGWVAEFTGSDISTKFPTFDDYLKLVAP